jgi:hypothetical protein
MSVSSMTTSLTFGEMRIACCAAPLK